MRHFAVIGDPVEHSRSPELYNRLFELNKIDADFVKHRVASSELVSFMELYAHAYDGFAVTMPHKRAILPCLDRIDASARDCGSVNIVKRFCTELVGYNTDGLGLVNALTDMGFEPSGSTVAILGRGGAALAAAHALKNRGADVTLLVRSVGMSAQTEALPFKQALFDQYAVHCDAFINATPLGMSGFSGFTDYEFIDKLSPALIFDMVYLSTGETGLIKEARERGISAESGSSMLKHQALLAFKIWFGADVLLPPVKLL